MPANRWAPDYSPSPCVWVLVEGAESSEIKHIAHNTPMATVCWSMVHEIDDAVITFLVFYRLIRADEILLGSSAIIRWF